jgi:hypothetical protein
VTTPSWPSRSSAENRLETQDEYLICATTGSSTSICQARGLILMSRSSAARWAKLQREHHASRFSSIKGPRLSESTHWSTVCRGATHDEPIDIFRFAQRLKHERCKDRLARGHVVAFWDRRSFPHHFGSALTYDGGGAEEVMKSPEK